jgi:DhnA family fructose-bisphosphate aldolase class Ia
MAFVGIPVELETYRIVARVAGECLRANLPLVVEALPCPGDRIPDPKAPDAMASAARIGFEHGADLIKSYYTEDFRRVTDNCPVPVLIAGGPRMETAADTLRVVQDAMQSGAAGVVFGRNIWQSGDTRGTINALHDIIHKGRPATEAESRIQHPALPSHEC